MMNGQKQGLDGRNRERACIELGIGCRFEKVFVDDENVKAYIDSRNLHRRHLTREQRQARVLKMRAEGQSIRQISGALGMGKGTVERDIADSKSSAGVPNGTPENNNPSEISPVQEADAPKVTGRDGKSYQAKKKADSEVQPEIPDRLRPIFASVPLFQQAGRQAERLANLFQEIEKTPAYLKGVEGTKNRAYSTYIRSAARAIQALTPKRPCPECGGIYEPSQDNDMCKTCGDRGYQTAEEV